MARKNQKDAPKTTTATPKATPKAKATDTGKLPANRVVLKRLERLSPADRKKAAAEFGKGTPIAEIAKKYDLKVSNARYTILSEAVRSGKLTVISATDVRGLKAALKTDGAAITACRAGISGTKLRELTK